jgi:antitoxin component YwqK of YwqJK toxin-antitoxin module
MSHSRRARPAHSRTLGPILLAALLAAACPEAGKDGNAGTEGAKSGESRGVRVETEYWDPPANTRKKSEGKTDYGRKIGEWTYWHENGSVSRKGAFVDGLEQGLFTSYYPSEDPTALGAKTEETNYEQGVRHGSMKLWFPNGQLALEETYEKGKKVGRGATYYENGKVANEAQWVDDGIEGSLKRYYDDGSLLEEAPHVKGKPHGTAVSYYPTGEKKEEKTYAEGVPTGEFKGWYANGLQRAHGQYENGLQSGVWEIWHANGKPAQVENYIDGKLEGETKVWFETGAVQAIRRYKDGVLDGLQQEWYADGTLKCEQEMTVGTPEYAWREFHPDGSRMKLGTVRMQNEKGTVRAYRVGPWYFWSDDGVLDMEQSGVYEADQRAAPLTAEQIAAAPSPEPAGG